MNLTAAGNVDRYKKKIVTIPNALTLFRVCLIPVIVWLYCFRIDPVWTPIAFLVSGATDIVDGFIARKFNMISDFGKAFDAVADKLTQISVLICLVFRFPLIFVMLVIFVVKEVLAATMNLITLKKAGFVVASVWHGKLNTVAVYFTIFAHMMWINIPQMLSNVLVAICIGTMALSSTLYTMSDIKAIKKKK